LRLQLCYYHRRKLLSLRPCSAFFAWDINQMNLDRYTYFASNNFKDYEFYSDGPKGRIKKIIRFTEIQIGGTTVYNLGFGDANSETNSIDDNIVTNNEDTDKVLATVANTIFDFTDYYGNFYIYAKGSTASRTRLYQISIARLWADINRDFELYGLKEDSWYKFERNVNYDAFLVRKK
jgi:hypothetical protein